jgi:hypothetical protein
VALPAVLAMLPEMTPVAELMLKPGGSPPALYVRLSPSGSLAEIGSVTLSPGALI